MSRPSPGTRPAAATSAAFAGAVDLSGLARKAAAPAGGMPAEPGAGDTPPNPYVVNVTEESFAQVMQLSSSILVVVDLWATWCQPCTQLSPVLEKLAGEGNGAWVLAKVDVDANPRIAQAFGAQSIPTVVAIAAGQPVDAFTGAQPEPQVRAWISALLDALRDKLPGIAEAETSAPASETGAPAEPPADPRFTAAEELLDAGDFAGAIDAYQKILDVEPANSDAAAAQANTVFLARVSEHTGDEVGAADAQPDDVAAQCAAADAELAAGQADAAFDRLVAAIARSADDDRTALREHLVSLFGLFDPSDPQVARARRALAAALY